MIRLASFFVSSPPWTADEALPGGDFSYDRFDEQIDATRTRWPFLGEAHARRLVEAYGSRLDQVLGDATNMDDLGELFGGDLTAAEVRYLMTHEFARFPEDILWRRSKLGLVLTATERDALAQFMAQPA
jgi:glycerol-3-phosphate dehydrogenase